MEQMYCDCGWHIAALIHAFILVQVYLMTVMKDYFGYIAVFSSLL